MKKLFINLILITALFVVSSTICSAQPGGGAVGGLPPCGPPFGGTDCPIDGGISFLIAAGLAFGGKKAHDLRKKN